MTDEPKEKESTAPDGFEKCPLCGSESRIAWNTVVPHMIRDGVPIPPRNRFGLGQVTMSIGQGKVVSMWFDACEECGCLYFVGKQETTPIAVPVPSPSKQGPSPTVHPFLG